MALPVEKRNKSEFRVARQQLIAGNDQDPAAGARALSGTARIRISSSERGCVPVRQSLRLKAWLLRLLRYLGQRLIRIHKFDVQSESQVMPGHLAPIKDPVPGDAKVATIDDEL